MDGDLSLSQSFGGLRIANPDNVPSGGGTDEQSILTPPLAPGFQVQSDVSTPRAIPSSPPLNTAPMLLPEQSQLPTSQVEPSLSQQVDHTLPVSTRPLSNYIPPSAISSSANLISRAPSYRIRTESSASSASEFHTRNDSRGGSTALQAGVPTRDNNHTDRAYKHSPFYGENAALPPRRSSRAAHNNAYPHRSSSQYNSAQGPVHGPGDWQERGSAVAVRQEIDPNGKPVSKTVRKGVRDFQFGRTLGEGSYSTVVAGTDRQTLKEYAIKILDKRHIIKEKKVKYVNIEKDTLNRLTEHPGIVRLYYTFQDENSLYFVLDIALGGELLNFLKRIGSFDEECTRFYGAEILDAIDYMHRRGIIHRDLKPENVLLDSQMHVKITDFGTAKILDTTRRPEEGSSGILSSNQSTRERASSFVGTAEYVSPELLTEKNACKASDLWAFGCIIYQLLAGKPPFKAANEYLTFQKIVNLDYGFPQGFPPVARDLVERLLIPDPTRRLPIEHIKNHEFFTDITWGRGLWRQKPPRLTPYIPPPPEPIKLNGNANDDSFPPNINVKSPPAPPQGSSRVYPRIITELPPPSRLDIEWSPVLTQPNERILKMGNLVVSTSSMPYRSQGKSGNGENEGPKKLSRLFGGATTKKRQRLVIVTTAGRVIMAPAGGDEKKAKLELSLLQPDVQYRSNADAKGHSSWIVDTRDKHFMFEEPKSSASDTNASALSTKEWLETIERSKELGSLNPTGDGNFKGLSPDMSSHANTLERSDEIAGGRSTLVKHQGHTDSDSVKAKKRFSRRHSKNGLSAVF
ncbi:serine/threonine protein kinase [Ophidiomyces ophidiicola]|uniref:Serine/threonine protein kinase n=1 Tax=Ophidiomyces ophidiicola TaxID=1387563 RepID=A0ACB8V2R8_9EURO|nr:serine/threonine protein kinase [Ophidiomyces ophidiicola]KAI1954706.1 serine/threonine protein kinase [Ophidiomyces ophidiicola]KAI1973426.1 serine/threonine protein kinase [Ophidiomyces ophidiicola]KAI2007606.1 serine/threonine protein kinase [Ophidiomyces ophidiicola]KAI2019606.1 serine/threonine protein kinase [Ophidiomyces ophidiicola]